MRRLFVLIPVMLLASTTFSMEIGGGLSISPVFRSVSYTLPENYDDNGMPPITFSGAWSPFYVNPNIFLDLTYIRFDAAYMVCSGYPQFKATMSVMGESESGSSAYSNSGGFFTISAIGKIPIKTSGNFIIWPAAGFEYDIDTAPNTKMWELATNNYSGLWIKAGLGAEFMLSDTLCLIPSVLFCLDLTPNSLVNSPDPVQGSVSDFVIAYNYAETAWRTDITLDLAYKFKSE